MDEEDGWSQLLSDRSVLGYQVKDAVSRIVRRRMFSDLSQADRDDLAGIAMGKYYETWGPLGRPRSIDAWLSTVMYRAAMDLYRERARLRPVGGAGIDPVQVLLDDRLPKAVSLSTPVVNADQVNRFLRQLSSDDAPLLWLKAHGYSHREIGELLGMRPNAVDVRLHRLRARLRGVMGTNGLDGGAG
jgi:RNA polymerase sigma factor (sigma-70 family)